MRITLHVKPGLLVARCGVTVVGWETVVITVSGEDTFSGTYDRMIIVRGFCFVSGPFVIPVLPQQILLSVRPWDLIILANQP